MNREKKGGSNIGKIEEILGLIKKIYGCIYLKEKEDEKEDNKEKRISVYIDIGNRQIHYSDGRTQFIENFAEQYCRRRECKENCIERLIKGYGKLLNIYKIQQSKAGIPDNQTEIDSSNDWGIEEIAEE